MERFEYIISKQNEWRDLYEAERRHYKTAKGRAEKERVKQRKREELEKSGENKISLNINVQERERGNPKIL